MSSDDCGQRVVRAAPQPSGRTERPLAPITGTVNTSSKELASYLESQDARYELGAIIRTGLLIAKGHREIADDVIAHLKKAGS